MLYSLANSSVSARQDSRGKGKAISGGLGVYEEAAMV